jgi:hypothetical protein
MKHLSETDLTTEVDTSKCVYTWKMLQEMAATEFFIPKI